MSYTEGFTDACILVCMMIEENRELEEIKAKLEFLPHLVKLVEELGGF